MALGVIDKVEVLASLLNCNNIYKASRVGNISTDLAIDLDKTLVYSLGLIVVEHILKTVVDKDD